MGRVAAGELSCPHITELYLMICALYTSFLCITGGLTARSVVLLLGDSNDVKTCESLVNATRCTFSKSLAAACFKNATLVCIAQYLHGFVYPQWPVGRIRRHSWEPHDPVARMADILREAQRSFGAPTLVTLTLGVWESVACEMTPGNIQMLFNRTWVEKVEHLVRSARAILRPNTRLAWVTQHHSNPRYRKHTFLPTQMCRNALLQQISLLGTHVACRTALPVIDWRGTACRHDFPFEDSVHFKDEAYRSRLDLLLSFSPSAGVSACEVVTDFCPRGNQHVC